MIEIIVACLVAGIIIIPIRVWIILHRSRRDRLRHHRHRFFEVAERILQAEWVEDDQLSRLDKMAQDMDDLRTFVVLVIAVWLFQRGKLPVTPNRRAPTEEWGELLFHYFLAITFRWPIAGAALREMLVQALEPQSSAVITDAINKRVHTGRLLPA